MYIIKIFILAILSTTIFGCASKTKTMGDKELSLSYSVVEDSLVEFKEIAIGEYKMDVGLKNQYVIFSSIFPDNTPVDTFHTSIGENFVEENLVYPRRTFLSNTTPVALNSVGEKYPLTNYYLISESPLTVFSENEYGKITMVWIAENGLLSVEQTFESFKDGYYSISTPELITARYDEEKTVVLPGYLHASKMGSDFVAAYAYGHYIPEIPVIYQDRCMTTPVSILQKEGVSIGIAPAREYPRVSYANGEKRHFDWNVGYGFMNIDKNLSPTLYYPVLGQPKSHLSKGAKLKFEYNYILSKEDWFDVYKKAVYDIYGFRHTRERSNQQALSDRILSQKRYLQNEGKNSFRKVEYENAVISAQDYLGGIRGADNDAMKNSDYGSMWMLANLSHDSDLIHNILPYVRNFKIKQIYSDGIYKGAPKGQYFLWKSKRWVEEWGQHIEPMAITYYSIADLANILLFEKEDEELENSIKNAADLLLRMQRGDGSWPLGIDLASGEEIFPDLEDKRPTFYGLLVAYQVLNNSIYLEAAKKGADWFVRNAVETNQYVGVCGDTRFAPDFSTVMAAQALLDLYDITKDEKYRQASIKAAEYYTTYVYTWHNNKQDLGFTQSGLQCEHVGTIGSANPQGPILLASHAGFFVRMFQQTNDSIYIDMARAAANGKDHFIHSKYKIAPYYWNHLDLHSDPYPQHVWWQIGWIMDYLVSEAEYRSEGSISFPRGYITPKVGPHKMVGHQPGIIDGEKVNLLISDKLLQNNNPDCEILLALSENKKQYYAVLMNSTSRTTEANYVLLGKTYKQALQPFGINIKKVGNPL